MTKPPLNDSIADCGFRQHLASWLPSASQWKASVAGSHRAGHGRGSGWLQPVVDNGGPCWIPAIVGQASFRRRRKFSGKPKRTLSKTPILPSAAASQNASKRAGKRSYIEQRRDHH